MHKSQGIGLTRLHVLVESDSIPRWQPRALRTRGHSLHTPTPPLSHPQRGLTRPYSTPPPPQNKRACYGVLRFIMESGAKGCEVIVSGKLRAARAKSMKFKDGYMVSSGEPCRLYLDSSVRHVLLRQGVLGIKVGGDGGRLWFAAAV